ncbi:MAG TPA: CaiB/BaiF CoA-transferase family protein [Acidimicrobiales bacterium]|nr:CaiB/BaiF CoA-transferase family protein [Acidimicrobiales bacterium]
MEGILNGYRVLDFTIAMSGSFASMRLGDLGADVIKVEPVGGEWQRRASAGGARGKRINASFLSLNRNKRSLAVDLKDVRGLEIVKRLAASSDVFIQNYRLGVAERLGLGVDAVRTINPSIVYVSISGYGESGPYAQRPGQDLLLQGLAGFMFSAGRAEDPPQPAPLYVVDAITAYSAFEGALAALLHRERTGTGQVVKVNMLDAIIAMQAQELTVFTVGGIAQQRSATPHAHCYIRAPYGIFRAKDGDVIIAFSPLALLGQVLGIPQFEDFDDELDGHRRRDEINELVAEAVKNRTVKELLELFTVNDIWGGPVNSYADLIVDPQVRANGSFVTYEHETEGTVTTPGFPIAFETTPTSVRRGAPLPGQHSREVLREIGLAEDEIEDLIAAGVIGEELP